MDLQIDLEAKCTATHEWVLIAQFRLAIEALDTAIALSKRNGYPYRMVDRRWPTTGLLTTVVENGVVVED
jgi:hypothetical protein